MVTSLARRITLVASAAMIAGAAFALTGCSSASHPIVSDQNACISCHNSEFAAVPGGAFNTSGAKYSATGEVSVTLSGANSFYVCRAVGSNQGDNKTAIPLSYQGPIRVAEGEAYALSLEAGSYVLIVQDGDTRTSQVLIVDPGATSTVDEITLKL